MGYAPYSKMTQVQEKGEKMWGRLQRAEKRQVQVKRGEKMWGKLQRAEKTQVQVKREENVG